MGIVNHITDHEFYVRNLLTFCRELWGVVNTLEDPKSVEYKGGNTFDRDEV